MPAAGVVAQSLGGAGSAGRLGITVRHVRRLIAEKRVPYLKVGRLVRFDPGEIARLLSESRQLAAAR
jgi:excisionase family DNA binding protein